MKDTDMDEHSRPGRYLSPAAARARYAADHGLTELPGPTRDALTPTYPEGTAEYAAYAAALRAELAAWKADR